MSTLINTINIRLIDWLVINVEIKVSWFISMKLGIGFVFIGNLFFGVFFVGFIRSTEANFLCFAILLSCGFGILSFFRR